MEKNLSVGGRTSYRASPVLAVRAEVISFKVYKLLGDSVAEVSVEHSIVDDTYIVCVRFKNGQRVHCREHELGSADFHAQCMMVYDLPG